MNGIAINTNFLLMLQLSLFTLAIFFISKLFSTLFYKTKATKNLIKEPPEPSGWLPLLGHIHLIGWRRQAALTLSELADQCGPMYTIWFGQRRGVVVNSWELAKECLTTHDKAMASRPRVAAGKFMGYNHSMMVIAEYGPYWRHVKKMVTVGLLSAKQIEQLKHVRAQEISIVVHQLYKLSQTNSSNPRPVDLKKWLMDVTFNILIMMVAGKRYYGGEGVEKDPDAAEFIKIMERALRLTGNLVPSDGVSWLEWLDFGGHIKSMKKTMKEFDAIASGWVEAHIRARKLELESGEERQSKDFMDLMLEAKEGELPNIPGSYDPKMFIKCTAVTLVIAGTDTTYVTLTWAISLLMNHKHVLKKAQEELDQVVGLNRNVEESDLQNLPYLQAIIKETLRVYPSSPNSVPHKTTEETYVSGYRIPADTIIFFNILKIHRDPTVWDEPCKFKPERFLASNYKGQGSFQLMPFGAGRRICPGMMLAYQVAELTLARLLHGFDFATPGDETVDMTEGYGLTMPKATPLNLILTPRLPSHLY